MCCLISCIPRSSPIQPAPALPLICRFAFATTVKTIMLHKVHYGVNYVVELPEYRNISEKSGISSKISDIWLLHHNIIFTFLSQYLTNLKHKICFTVSFISCLYMFRAHVLIIRRCSKHVEAWNKTYCETNFVHQVG